MNINHNAQEAASRNIGMLLPLGDYLNTRILEMEIGSEIICLDGVKANIISKCVISSKSDVAKSLSFQIYGLPIEKIIELMQMNWNADMNKDELIYLVIKAKQK